MTPAELLAFLRSHREPARCGLRGAVLIFALAACGGSEPAPLDQPHLDANEHLRALQDAGLPFAQHSLETQGGFYPFGMTMDASSAPALAMALEDDDQPTNVDALAHLRAALRSAVKAQGLVAVATFVDVRVTRAGTSVPVDAVQITFEDKTGLARSTWVPYHVGTDGKLSLDATWQEACPQQFFVP